MWRLNGRANLPKFRRRRRLDDVLTTLRMPRGSRSLGRIEPQELLPKRAPDTSTFCTYFLDKVYDVSALSDVIIKSNENRIWMFYTEIQETLCLTCNIFKYVPFLWPTVFFPCIYRTFIFCFRLLDNDVREHKVAREKGKKCVPWCISTQHRSSQDNAQPGSKITKTFMNNTFSINSTLLKQRQVKTAWKVDFSVS